LPSLLSGDGLPPQPLALLPNRVHRNYQGGAELDRFRGAHDPRDTDQPEDWVGSTTAARQTGDTPIVEGISDVRLPTGEVVPLPRLLEAHAEELLGAAHMERFGNQTALLVKLLDAASRLPVHAHPDRAFAARHLHAPFGKTEAWIIVRTRKLDHGRPYILLGMQEDRTSEQFEVAVREQDTAALTGMLHRIDVLPGDVYFVRAGIPHAIGEGILMVEVQEPTDFSFVAEYANLRVAPERAHGGLGWDLALQAFDTTPFSRESLVQALKRTPTTIRQQGGNTEQLILDTEFFSARRISLVSEGQLASDGRFNVAIVISGTGTMAQPGGDVTVRAGDAFILPAAMAPVRLSATPGERLEVLRCLPGSL
jgi:mannose-6-phosphate isomerase